MSVKRPCLIQVVEDDDAVRSSTRLLLETLGYAVADFASPEAFLEAAGEGGAACILLDYHLGSMNGAEVLEALRARGINTPAVIITANSKVPASRLTRAGAAAVLPKPPVTADLLALIEKFCGKRN